MIEGKITSVESVKAIKEDLNQIEVTVDEFSTYTVFGKFKDYLSYLDKEVEFEVREDVIDGTIHQVICNVAVRSIVQTLDETGDYVTDIDEGSLIPDKSKAIDVITFDKDALRKGDVAKSEVVLVSGYKQGKSKLAKWTDFTCLDVNSKAFNLRLFTNSDDIDSFRSNVVGKYVMVDIKNEDKYGLQVFGDIQLYEHEVQVPAEVLLSAMRLKIAIGSDEELKEYVEKYDFINTLKTQIYFEPGYHLVEMASELILINAICKVYEGYDRKLLLRTVFASRGYLLGSSTNLSNPLVNYHRIITSGLRGDFELLKMIDITNGVEDGDLDKSVYLSIRRQVTSIMKGRRGINEHNKINTIINDVDSEFSGLFQRGLSGLD